MKLWILGVGLALASASAVAEESRCASCHLANPHAPAADHLADWDSSPHGRHNVGCENCHGGDATTFELIQAHQGMLSGSNPASPVHRRNLPETCGRCHPGQLTEFRKSRHYQLLRTGDDEGPTCATCHGEVGARLLSPKGLAVHCGQCHGAGKAAPRPEYPLQGLVMHQGVGEVRALLKEARSTIRRVKDKSRREELEVQFRRAEQPLAQAIESGHAFVFDQLEARLEVARKRAEALLEALANPPAR